MPTESNAIYKVTHFIMKLVLVNLLWLLFNLPLLFILFNAFFVEHVEDLAAFIIPVLISIPIFLFPSTSAMFVLVRRWVLTEEVNGNLFNQFWQGYKKYYKRSLFGGFILTVIWVILIVDILLFLDKSRVLIYLFMMVSVLLFVLTMNFFSTMVHFEQKLLTIFKNASLITFSRPMLLLTLTIGSFIIVYVSVYLFQFLLVLCTGSLLTLLSFYLFNRHYLK